MLYEFGELSLDDQQFTLKGPAGPIHLEPQVFSVLRFLIVNAHRVVSKEELLDGIWGDRFVSESALTSRVKAARRAVGDDGQAQRVIRTVHARGYQFVAEVRVVAEDVRRNIPGLRSQMLGRERDVDGVVERIEAARLVTIVGPGGVGKTTLALSVARQVQADFTDGAVFVDLAQVPPGADVTRALADAAGVEGDVFRTVEGVADHLADRPVLLVLDNCEHVLTRAAVVVDRILTRGTTARVLATSRESLGVGGEHVWPLGPLIDAGPDLFVERARAAEPRGEWDPTDPMVVDLCNRLDNVPLALELAAGQLRRFPLAELADRFGSQLSTLPDHDTGDAQRHATMEGAIDWSYQLLDGSEQELLRHLSVFPASFDLAAVEGSAPGGRTATVLFGELVDKSLVVRDPSTGRYRLLETVRAFAHARLERAGEADAAVERHRAHVCRTIASSSRLDRWLSGRLAATFRIDLQNARQAFRVSIDQGLIEDAVEVAIGGTFLWRNAIGYTEGDAWVQELLAADLSPPDRLWVHLLEADVGQGRGDHRQMFSAASAAVRAAADVDDAAAGCLAAHYDALAHLTDPEQARERFAPVLELARAADDRRLETLMQAFLGVGEVVAGDHRAARGRLDALVPDASRDGYDSFILHWAGWLLGLAEVDAAGARRWMDRQHDYLERTGIVETWITTFSTALCEVVEGVDIKPRLSHTLALADREGYRAEADCLLALAYAELCARRYEPAAELIGTAMQTGFNSTAHYVLFRAAIDNPLRRHLEAGVYDAALLRGRGQAASDAIAGYGITRG